jgi:hypothetical protein
MLMVAPVMRRPPEWTLLKGRTSKPRHNKLKHAARLICLVRKIAMITRGDPEHADDIKEKAQKKCLPGNACEKDQKASQMETEKRQALQIVNSILNQLLTHANGNGFIHEDLKRFVFGSTLNRGYAKYTICWDRIMGKSGQEEDVLLQTNPTCLLQDAIRNARYYPEINSIVNTFFEIRGCRPANTRPYNRSA